jgi:phosphoribosylformylglycinamidine synthase PurS subunit
MKVTVNITRRPEIADPQGSTVLRALGDLGHNDVSSVRIDRTIHLDVDGTDPVAVKSTVEDMCRQLLANPVLEDFEVEVDS